MATRTQQQALKVYYAAMPDQELQHAAANKNSFLPIVQRLLEEELKRRHLAPQDPTPSARGGTDQGVMRGLRHAFRH
jgi:hypothetical protein